MIGWIVAGLGWIGWGATLWAWDNQRAKTRGAEYWARSAEKDSNFWKRAYESVVKP